MTRETYHLAKPVFYVACVLVGVGLSAWPRSRHPEASRFQKAVLALGSIVVVVALAYPAALLYVDGVVPIRDEGLQLALEYLIFVGPVALVCLIASLASKGIRVVGSLMALSYLVGGLGILALDSLP